VALARQLSSFASARSGLEEVQEPLGLCAPPKQGMSLTVLSVPLTFMLNGIDISRMAIAFGQALSGPDHQYVAISSRYAFPYIRLTANCAETRGGIELSVSTFLCLP
jgi:hypothetical protein